MAFGLTVELESLISPLFWVSYAGWIVLGFSLFPIRVAIPNRQKAIGPFLWPSSWVFAAGAILALVLLTGRNSSPFLPLIGGIPGVFVGTAINFSISVLPFQRAAFCSNCAVVRRLAKDHAVWYCTTCGQPVGVAPESIKARPAETVYTRKVPKPIFARKVAKDSGDDRESESTKESGKV
jgi:hypothetical protein